jgi:hypothetical protein
LFIRGVRAGSSTGKGNRLPAFILDIYYQKVSMDSFIAYKYFSILCGIKQFLGRLDTLIEIRIGQGVFGNQIHFSIEELL